MRREEEEGKAQGAEGREGIKGRKGQRERLVMVRTEGWLKKEKGESGE